MRSDVNSRLYFEKEKHKEKHSFNNAAAAAAATFDQFLKIIQL